MTGRPDILYLFRGAGHGGDAIATLRLAAAMRDRGLAVRCAASPFEDRFDAFSARAASLGLPCDPVKYYDAGGGSRIRFAAALGRYVRTIRPRVIHLETGNGFVNPSLAMTLATVHRGRRVATLQGVRSHELTDAKHIRDQNISERFFHSIITPTHYSRKSYLRCAAKARPERVHAIGNLGDAALPKPRCETRKSLGIDCKAKVVLFAARLVETKGPLVAIRAFDRIAERHPTAVLLVAGDGPELDACRAQTKQLSDRARVLGHRDDVTDLMAAADIFITPSHFESFGLTTLEAMATGACVLAFDIPATREVLGGLGRLAPFGDETALAAQLDQALADPTEFRERAHERYETVYSKDAIVRQHLSIYGLER